MEVYDLFFYIIMLIFLVRFHLVSHIIINYLTSTVLTKDISLCHWRQWVFKFQYLKEQKWDKILTRQYFFILTLVVVLFNHKWLI